MPNRRLVVFFFVFAAIVVLAARAEAQFSVAGSGSPEDYHVELGVNFWKPSPDIVIRAGAGSTDVDLIDIFSIEDAQFTEFKGVLKAGRKHKIRFQYVPIAYAKDTTVNRTFTFQGRTFTVNVPASTDFKWTLMRFGYEWDVVSTDRGFVGVFGDVKYNTVEATLSSPVVGTTATDVTAPIPTIGGIARGYLGSSVSVTGEFTGLKITRDEFEGKFFDFDIYGTLNLGRHIGIQGGYRSLDVDYLTNDGADVDSGTFKMKGPYFGGVVRF